MTAPDVSQFGIPVASELTSVQIGGQCISYFKVTNIDALYAALSQLDSKNDNVIDERIPYWAELWPSAIALAEYVCDMGSTDGTIVHEIGCGMALPSILCGKLGYKVVMSDYVLAPLQFAEANWKLNSTTQPITMILDWRNIPDSIEKCDLLLAADVAYESRMFSVIIHAFKELTKKGGKIIITEPNRKFASDFYKLLEQNFSEIKTYDKLIFLNNHQHKIRLSVITV
ncbi:MAG TPA: hypothetical protein PKC85_09485 [Bacteroidia bacterium]|nr:hypothetical protein [Bacteroidia bacterium]HMU20061.1 hypothetical protein [Bacteroidia bacterium]